MALEYKLRENDGEPVCCDSCNSAAPTSDFNWASGTGKHDKPYRPLCEFCSSTMTSRYTEYPQHDQYGQMRAEVWRANAALFNALKFGLNGEGVAPTAPSVFDELTAYAESSEAKPTFADAVRIALAAKRRQECGAHGEPGNGEFATPSGGASQPGSAGCDPTGRQIDVGAAPHGVDVPGEGKR